MTLDIGELVRRAESFAGTLSAARFRIADPLISWYPYQPLSNLRTFDRFLTGDNRVIFETIHGQPLLDVGCADGDLAFLFESAGFSLDAIDHPVPNYNAMRGVRALKRELGSGVGLHSIDLDRPFELPRQQYGLAVALGVIYHLKNPFYLLEALARQCHYGLFSSALTDVVPALDVGVSRAPLAYLADAWELNGDPTNYWICSDAGFRRLLDRANWEILEYSLVTEHERIAGQRAFCLARSKFSNTGLRVLYGRGWHAPEEGGWRWTEREFAIRLESSLIEAVDHLRLNLFIPEAVLAGLSAITLRAIANGIELAPETFSAPGEYELVRSLAPWSTAQGDVRIDFVLDSALPPGASDRRERGIIVAEIGGFAIPD